MGVGIEVGVCHLGVGVGVWVGCVAIDFVLVSKGGAATSEEGRGQDFLHNGAT